MASDHSGTDHDPMPPQFDPAHLPNNTLLPLNIRLDRTNYTYWRALAMAAVRAYNLEGFLTGSIPPPPHMLPGNIPNPSFHNWLRFDQFLTNWLLNSMTEAMVGHVIQCRSSSEIWQVLAANFATRSKARILQIQGLLQNTKKGSTPIDDYVLKMKQLGDYCVKLVKLSPMRDFVCTSLVDLARSMIVSWLTSRTDLKLLPFKILFTVFKLRK